MATSSSSKTGSKKAVASTAKPAGEELKTDFPMSEKDEVKKAEERMKKQTKGK
jgi:hypothetical protein